MSDRARSSTRDESPSSRAAASTVPVRVVLLTALLVAAIVFVAFIPALAGQFLNYDDDRNFTVNQDYRGLAPANLAWMFTTFHMGHYHPVTWLTLGLDYVLWGMNPFGYHLTNNLLHSIHAALVFLVALRLLQLSQGTPRTGAGRAEKGRKAEGATVPGPASSSSPFRAFRSSETNVLLAAAAGALFFGLHPLRVESVAWLTERRDLVGALFLSLTVLAYLRGVDPGRAPRSRRRWLGASVVLYLLSMMGKVSGMPLPAVLLALDWYPLRRLPGSADGAGGIRPLLSRWRPLVIEKLPLFAVAFGFALVATIGQAGQDWIYPLSMHGMPARIMEAFYGLAFYLWKTLAPHGLLPIYELRFPMDPWQPRLVAAAIVVTLSAAAIAALRRRLPGLLVASLAYAAFLAPVLGLVQNGPQLVADRYSYLAMLGFSILAGGAWMRVLRSSSRVAAPIAVLASFAILASFSALAWRQCRVWRDPTTLWQYVLAQAPDTAMALNSEGGRLLNEQKPAAALPLVQRAVELAPYNLSAQHNLRTIYAALGRMDDFRRLLEAGSQSPEPLHAAEFQFHLGYLAFEQGRLDDAIASFGRTLESTPDRAEAHLYWALALERLSRGKEAEPHYRAAARLKPRLARGLADTAREAFLQGQTAQAAGMAQIALKVDPRCPEARTLMAEIAAQQARPR